MAAKATKKIGQGRARPDSSFDGGAAAIERRGLSPLVLTAFGIMAVIGILVVWLAMSPKAQLVPVRVVDLPPLAKPAAAAQQPESLLPTAASPPAPPPTAAAAPPAPPVAPATQAMAPPPPTTAPPTPPAPAPAASPTGALAPAPDQALIERTDAGLLPVKAQDGRAAWRIYARPFTDLTDRPRIAIVVSGLGLQQATTDAAIQALPPEVSLSFSPYAADLEAWVEKARAAGHEVLVQLPLEPVDYPTNDTGSQTLLSTASWPENQARLHWVLARFPGYVGVATFGGGKFTDNAQAMRPLVAELNDRGLMLFDALSARRSVAGKLSQEVGTPRAYADVAIDAKQSHAAVDAALSDLEHTAQASGIAVGVSANPAISVPDLAVWTRTLQSKGLVLAPVSALANRQRIE